MMSKPCHFVIWFPRLEIWRNCVPAENLKRLTTGGDEHQSLRLGMLELKD